MSAALEVTMPRLSDSMEEGTLLRWLMRDGEAVSVGDELAEIESDKATMVYEAQAAGVLSTAVDEGTTVAVGTVIAWLGGEGAAGGDEPRAAGRADVTPVAAQAAVAGAPAARNGAQSELREPSKAVRRKASPVARRMAATHGIDLALVDGTGPDGRIVRADVELCLAQASVPLDGGDATGQAQSTPDTTATGGRGEVTVHSLTRAQSLVAQRMSQSRQQVPDFEVRARVDAGPLSAMRAQVKGHDPAEVPSVNDFVVMAAARALREQPRSNGSHRGATWELYGRVNVGVAVATEGGLIVPTIFDADRRSLGEIARATRDLASRAREGRITPQELDGATFTVSNLGMFGIDGFSAVISPGQAAILAVGAVVPTPVVRDGAVVPGLLFELALSCDHRILYGADAARLLTRIRELLEHPIALLVS